MRSLVLTESVGRETDGVACPRHGCNGYADQVTVTEAEEREYGSGRSGCCARAFVCRRCKRRIVGRAESPEMEDF